MGFLVRLGGISLILGGLLFFTGAIALFRYSSILVITGESVGSSPDWVGLASRGGIALMVLGGTTAFTALFVFVRSMRASVTYIGYSNEGSRLNLSSSRNAGSAQEEQGVDDIITTKENSGIE